MTSPSQLDWSLIEAHVYKPSECYSILTRVSKHDINCPDAPLPDDMLSLCAALEIPLTSSLFSYMNQVNDLSPKIEDWDSLIGDIEEKPEEQVVPKFQHPGRAIRSLQHFRNSKTFKAPEWSFRYLTYALHAATINIAKFDPLPTGISNFTKSIKLNDEGRGLHHDILSEFIKAKTEPVFQRAASEELRTPLDMKEKIFSASTLLLEPFDPPCRYILEPAEPDTPPGGTEDYAEALPSPPPRPIREKTSSWMSDYEENSNDEFGFLQQVMQPDEYNYDYIVKKVLDRLPWDMYKYERIIFRSIIKQNLVQSVKSFSLNKLGHCLPSINYTLKSPEILQAQSLVKKMNELVAEDWINERADNVSRQAREARDSAQPHRIAQWHETFKGSGICRPESLKIISSPLELYLNALWSDHWTNDRWQKIRPSPFNESSAEEVLQQQELSSSSLAQDSMHKTYDQESEDGAFVHESETIETEEQFVDKLLDLPTESPPSRRLSSTIRDESRDRDHDHDQDHGHQADNVSIQATSSSSPRLTASPSSRYYDPLTSQRTSPFPCSSQASDDDITILSTNINGKRQEEYPRDPSETPKRKRVH